MDNALQLTVEWKQYTQAQDEVNKLYDKGNELWTESRKLYDINGKPSVEARKLQRDGEKFYEEGRKIHFEAKRLWLAAVRSAFGNIRIQWTLQDGCQLENGEVYM